MARLTARAAALPLTLLALLLCGMVLSVVAQGQGSLNPKYGGEDERQAVLFGHDDRKDTQSLSYNEKVDYGVFTDADVAFISNTRMRIDYTDPDKPVGKISDNRRYIKAKRNDSDETGTALCSDVKFYNDSNSAFCSGTLVGPSQVLSAGHCLGMTAAEQKKRCSEIFLVLGYQTPASGGDFPLEIPFDQIYTCKSFAAPAKVNIAIKTLEDWSVIELDRPVPDTRPWIDVADPKVAPIVGDSVLVVGHPNGLLMKVEPAGKIRSVAKRSFDFNSDLFAGNSGGMVVDVPNKRILGVAVFGQDDYVVRNGTDPVCIEPKTCPETGCTDGYIAGLDSAMRTEFYHSKIVAPMVRFPVLSWTTADKQQLKAIQHLMRAAKATTEAVSDTPDTAKLETALQEFQRKEKITVTGQPDPSTLFRLIGGKDVTAGAASDLVQAVQALLLRDDATVKLTSGVYNQQTITAVTKFQKKNSIKATGTVNKQTWPYLFGGTLGGIPDHYKQQGHLVSGDEGRTAVAANDAPKCNGNDCPASKVGAAFLEVKFQVRNMFGLASEQEKYQRTCCDIEIPPEVYLPIWNFDKDYAADIREMIDE